MYKDKESIIKVLYELQDAVNSLHTFLAKDQSKGDEPHDSIEEAYKGIGDAISALECIE